MIWRGHADRLAWDFALAGRDILEMLATEVRKQTSSHYPCLIFADMSRINETVSTSVIRYFLIDKIWCKTVRKGKVSCLQMLFAPLFFF